MSSEPGLSSPRLPAPPARLTGAALFLDLDGVLAPLAPTPDAVVPEPRRTATIERVTRALDGRVAVVSGRTLAEIDRIVGGAARAASGVHGLERRRADGALTARKPAPSVRAALAAFAAFADARPGVIVEDKGLSAGLHFRQAPDHAEAALAMATALANETGLALQPGAMVLELKTPGADKGTAVAAFMAEPPFAGATPVMVGDDLTDEAGFLAAAALGGFGVLVGPERPTAARYRLEGVGAVLDWLGGLAAAATDEETRA
ncbi:trehalose-phosphatase [Brevundimonas naejangsanensis]|uniref:Trehalose 6-phosphate phosphatase n=1 Tax=Brevundimonas naejangsanensis TaxID=588932 RepID=A0A494RDB2_9CAUL|nr:trehalose-phosphatase [Brevundimonas naejangsanensis]AYG94307.1 trehalose-phosphatase [Brevundimonas naejangsanensis]